MAIQLSAQALLRPVGTELYLTSQRWWNFASEDWTEAGDGVVVNLDQVRTISVSSDQPAEVGAADSLAEA